MTTTVQRPQTAQTTALPQPVRRRRRDSLVPYVFVGPAAIFFIVMILVPLIYAIYLSFRGQRISGGGAFGRKQDVFVGFENYLTTFTDPELLASLGRMLVYSAIMVPGLVTVFLLQFIGIWNNFMLPFIMLSDDRKFPLTMGLYMMLNRGASEAALYTLTITGAAISVIPLLALVLWLQRFWRLDLLSGGLKG